MRYVIIALVIFMLMSNPVFAHGLTDDMNVHVQQFIAGVGVIAILIAGIYSLLGNRSDDESLLEADLFETPSDSDSSPSV